MTEETNGWKKRFDELHQDPTRPMPGPWHWEVHDSSMATLCGGGEDAIIGHIMSIGPCKACYAGKEEWEWGRCGTPTSKNARLISASASLFEYVEEAANNGCVTARDLVDKVIIPLT